MTQPATSKNADATSAFGPIAEARRIQALDVVRGFALLGILLMNMEAFVGPIVTAGSGIDPALRGIDRWADALVYFFVQGKFYTLFSLLFGMGFAVMSLRAEAARRAFAGLYWRRTLALLGIGLAHALLVWSGDILVTYALVSVVLLLFRQIEGKWLVLLALLAYAGTSALMLAIGAVDWSMQLAPGSAAQWNQAMDLQATHVAAQIEGQRQAFGAGSYAEAVAQRLQDFVGGLGSLIVIGPLVLGMFLLGKWFVESGAIVEPGRYPRLFARLRWWASCVGLLLMLASSWLRPTMPLDRMDLHSALAFVLSTWASLLLCLAYLAWLVRALEMPRVAARLAWLAPAGRMALTNYLMQSVVCTLVFYGYGLGWFERLPRAWQMPFALGLFAMQVLLSRVWLARFRFGPLEWLWRSLTYLAWQPMRKDVAG